MKKVISSLLALTLMATPALASGSFPSVNAYPGFSDVPAGSWYASAVQVCYETGLMKGTGTGFQPDGTITAAECAAIAARLLEAYSGEPIPGLTPLPGQELPWYQQYVGYLASNGVTVSEPTKNATRQQFFDLLAAVTPASELSAINSITTLPDTSDQNVLAFYNAGILTGTDSYGTFAGDKTLQRSEVAAMLARLVQPELRQSFVPQTASAPAQQPQEDPTDPTVLTVNGQAISRSTLMAWMLQVIYRDDAAFYQQGSRLNWNADYGVGDLEDYYLQYAVELTTQSALLDQKAAALGCTTDDLPAKLTPDPGKAALSAYAQEQDYLCAKHILVSDESTAQSIISTLNAQPNMTQFNNILSLLGTDPGMASNPDGYLFSSGEMVEEFEAGTRALDIGSFSQQPVQSSFGYHVIWRLDPADHPDLLDAYQVDAMLDQLDTWTQEATVSKNQAVLDAINVQEEYSTYLNYLASQQK